MTWMSWQIDYLLLLQSFREATGGVLNHFFLNISNVAIMPFAIMLICAIYWGVNKKAGIYLLYCFFFSILTNLFIKHTACIYRPWILDSRVTPPDIAYSTAGGYSFPSGHTAEGTALWGGIATFWWQHKFLRIFCIALIFLIMFSRNYLGVHTPQDVLVSFILGIGILYLIKKVINWVEQGKNRDIIVLILLTILCSLIAAFIWFKSYPIDYNAQGEILYDATDTKIYSSAKIIGIIALFLGMFFENRFIKFSTENCELKRKIIRITVGLCLFKLFTIYSNSFIHSIIHGFKAQCLENILTAIFITIIFPCFIKLADIVINSVKNRFSHS